MKISVFITSYNQRTYLAEAVESVLNQTLAPYQVIIVDDCSEDGSQELIASYASRYPDLITPIYHAQNYGVSWARVHALQAVSGDYVTYVDGDDRILPTKLEKEAALFVTRPDTDIVFSDFYLAYDHGKREQWAANGNVPEGDVFAAVFARRFPKRTLFRNEMVNYGAWKRIGFHDPNLNLYEDYDMRIRLSKNLRAAFNDEPLAEYRLHGSGLSSTHATHHLAALEYIYKKNSPLLKTLDTSERMAIKRNLERWMAGIARQALIDSVRNDSRSRATRRQAAILYRYYIRYSAMSPDHLWPLLAVLLPARLFWKLHALLGRPLANEAAN